MRITIAMLALAAAGVAGTATGQGMNLMEFADGDKDGKVSAAEYTAFMEQGWGFFSNGGDKVKVAELQDMAKPAFVGITPDANGEVSKDAYMAMAPGRFKAADKNGDGSLSEAELNATMAPPS